MVCCLSADLSAIDLDDRIVTYAISRDKSTDSALCVKVLYHNLVMVLPLAIPFFVYIADRDRVAYLCTKQVPAS